LKRQLNIMIEEEIIDHIKFILKNNLYYDTITDFVRDSILDKIEKFDQLKKD